HVYWPLYISSGVLGSVVSLSHFNLNPVYAHAGEDVTLSCSVDTHVNVSELQVEWRKTDDDGDILVLLYADGENRPESQDGRYSRRAEFFTEEIPKGNFSMKLRKVRTEDKGEFRCEAYSDTDPGGSTTARIAAVGESPGHLHKVSHRGERSAGRANPQCAQSYRHKVREKHRASKSSMCTELQTQREREAQGEQILNVHRSYKHKVRENRGATMILCNHLQFLSFLLHGSAGPLTAWLGGAVLLPCFVDRPLPLKELQVDWRRTDSDTIVHLFQDGQSRPESQGDAYRDRAHFFSQEIPKGNFSLLLDGVRTADAGVYKCVAYTEQEQHETRVEIQELGVAGHPHVAQSSKFPSHGFKAVFEFLFQFYLCSFSLCFLSFRSCKFLRSVFIAVSYPVLLLIGCF
uniref:Ig-like domain-containing protein n=1 Tax=Paramormyrops kingsleyae TaxID=1676925 RepID=A0A3B3TFF7_9TELE